MALRSMTVHRYEEIRRRLAEGRSLHEIARALSCSRCTVREVRDGERLSPDAPKVLTDPLWMTQLDWPTIIHDLGLGHPLKFLWEEKAKHLTTYSNFWKQFYRKFPQYREASVTAREFEPGERVEVDYAGDPIAWIHLPTGEIRKAWVFVAGLGFSQLLFAWAAEDMKSRNWLASHRRMFAYYGGVPHVTVPDCLKQGVVKCHLYDPDLNPGYAQLASHYGTAVVAAWPGHPKDKTMVSYCTLFCCWRGGGDWRQVGGTRVAPGAAFDDRMAGRNLPQATMKTVGSPLLDQTISSPLMDSGVRHPKFLRHLAGREQAAVTQPLAATFEFVGAADEGNFFQVKPLIFPSPPTTLVQDRSDFAITVMIGEHIDLCN